MRAYTACRVFGSHWPLCAIQCQCPSMTVLHETINLSMKNTNAYPVSQCTIAQTSLIIHAPPPTSEPLERYVFSTVQFPRIPSSDVRTPFSSPLSTNLARSDPLVEALAKPRVIAANERMFNPPPTSDLAEQFRATLTRLGTSIARLLPLPEDCSFTVAIEMREEDEVEAPISKEARWIAAEPGLQRDRQSNGKGKSTIGIENLLGENGSKKGKDLGGVRTVPVRSLEAGAFAMEVWVEEGKGKFKASVEEADE